MQKKWLLYSAVAVMAMAIACGGDTKTPVSPTPATSSDSAAAAADGSTLKVSAPSLTSPSDGSTTTFGSVSLVVQNATAKFVPQTVPTYQFVVVDSGNATIFDSGAVAAGTATTAAQVPANALKAETTYRWRARGTSGSAVGPWSNYFSFTTPKAGGYQTLTTLWDPLVDGKSIGRPSEMEFILGKGARTVSFTSYIQYPLRQTLTQGEMSFYVDNFNPLAQGGKTKFASMSSDAADVTTDPWRFTLEKRGASYPAPGQVRWRIITGNAEAAVYDGGPWVPVLDKTKTHFIKFTWGNGVVGLLIAEADPTTGALGTVRLNVSVGYKGTYRPNPHMAYIGAEAGRGGVEDASVPNMTVRYVWISDGTTPRPSMSAADLRIAEGEGY